MHIDDKIQQTAQKIADEGKTPLFFSNDSQLLGIIAVADTIKEDSPEAIQQFRNMGLKTVMLTGDNERTANAIGSQVGVDLVIAGVLPNEKESVICSLQEQGKVAMIGDGINDAPALTRADIGIAIGAGTDIAIDAADVVLMKSQLTDAVSAIRLSRQTMRNIWQNLFWAFIYNVIGIPLAAGAYIKLFGWELNPMFGAAAMSLSSFCVVTNALRLNLVKIHSSKHDKPIKNQITELNFHLPEKSKTYTFQIVGMMCPHCEATVKKCLESFPEIQEATADHTKGTAIAKLSGELSHLDEIKQAITDKGYEVTGGSF